MTVKNEQETSISYSSFFSRLRAVFAFFTIVSVPLQAQSTAVWQENKMYFDFGLSSPQVSVNKGDQSALVQSGVILNSQSTSGFQNTAIPNRTLGDLLIAQSLVNPKAEGLGLISRLGIEYGLTKYFGIGASFNNTSLEITRYNAFAGSSWDLASYFFLIAGTRETVNSIGILKNWEANQNRRVRLETLDSEISLHIPLEGIPIDPYLRLSYGTSTNPLPGNTSYSKRGGTIGMRYMYNSMINLSLEFYNSRFDFYQSAGNTSANATESGLRFSVGTSMNSP